MNAALLAIIVLILYFLAYRYYSKFLANKIFRISDDEVTPAHEKNDGMDFVPSNKHVLFGHHFASIAGAAPIIGPAIAVFWGWVPAIIWVVLGTIFMGAVHDFSALVISVREKGRSVGDLAGILINPRARTLFLLIVYFLIFFVIAVFAYAIASLFVAFPESVLPVNFQIIVAVIIGFLFYKKGVPILWPSILALISLYVMIWVGTIVPIEIPAIMGSQIVTWIFLLLIYSFIASVLPVWTLLQPRDYINGHQLILGLGLLFIGLLVAHPEMQAPAINHNAEGGVPLFPFIFVTIACGAISGFHGLVSSGTTSKQLNKMKDSRMIGYGGMLGEGALAMIATLAVAAGISRTDWLTHYETWDLAAKGGITNFVHGASTFLEALHIPTLFGDTLISVIVISFAATSLDTAARVQRLILGELGTAYEIKPLKNRYVGALLAVVPALLLALLAEAPGKGLGSGGFLLWPLFGATNQLVAGLTLLIATIYLWKTGRPVIYTLIPMVFLIVMTIAAMIWSFKAFADNPLLLILSAIILALSVWLLFEAYFVYNSQKRSEIVIPDAKE
ncbi:MAG: carbon starvation protein A [Candidatus Dadabacteria bacterium]|nr:carbon starvation protein A [Candidatus Dadabacteria bacterium]MCZ6639110.1 carbon starvation protein A [Candidatus Dadabacteria bacterium]MCZ6790311.1 carbon starvation protein A [Candidatus Dadabacteria bacterium]